jgi:NADPH:quinone reductase-like Zn-dependent oxidoreductase
VHTCDKDTNLLPLSLTFKNKKMKGIILTEAGSVDNLKYIDLPIPSIKENEVLVKVKALSINPVDYKARSNSGSLNWLFGAERPVILGWDLSGTVVEVGKNAQTFKVNDAVFGMANFPGKGNAYAEYVAVPAAHLTLKPTNVSYDDAAVATLAALTAWQVLFGHIKKGDTILIHGTSGGVGHYAVQIAKYLGAYVIGTSSGKNKVFSLGMGVDKHIDYTLKDFEKMVANIDFVFDTVGGDLMARSINITRQGGKIVTIPTGNIPPNYLEKAKIKSIDLSFVLVKSSGEDMAILADLMQKGILKSHISHTFTFDEMAKAHLQLETGRTVGKIVLTV